MMPQTVPALIVSRVRAHRYRIAFTAYPLRKIGHRKNVATPTATFPIRDAERGIPSMIATAAQTAPKIATTARFFQFTLPLVIT